MKAGGGFTALLSLTLSLVRLGLGEEGHGCLQTPIRHLRDLTKAALENLSCIYPPLSELHKSSADPKEQSWAAFLLSAVFPLADINLYIPLGIQRWVSEKQCEIAQIVLGRLLQSCE